MEQEAYSKVQVNKLSAIAFVLVLLFVMIAGFVIYTNVRQELLRPPALPSPAEPLAELTPAPQSPQPTATPTWTPAPAVTPLPTLIMTLPAATAQPTIQVATPTPWLISTRTPTPADTTSALTPLPPSPTPTQPGRYAFYLEDEVQHDLNAGCMAQYIRGEVRDRAGRPLEGVRIKVYDIWGNEAYSTSKGGVDIGKWDVVLGPTPNIWHVVVVDNAGQALSPVAVVPHHQEGAFKDACVHIVNWRRSW